MPSRAIRSGNPRTGPAASLQIMQMTAHGEKAGSV
jgi:hypothetical protein